jgi:UDP-N-acetylmuramoyl-L-alanyl-D-glutamate--2,6-diaminopimelate ligase
MDYHKDMEDYYQAKRKLFSGETLPKPKRAIINMDDPWGQRLFSDIPEGEEVLTFGSAPGCDLQILESTSCYEGSHFTLKLGSRRYKGWLPMVGAHNLHNAIGALAVAYALGLSLKQAVADLESFPGVPGRLERIYAGQPFEVIVDYAHTDEALRQTLEALRPLYKGRIITVFGCGGNRDEFKRPRMTQVAMEGSDYTFATSDNPRREQIQDIFTQMKVGAILGKPIEWIADRRQAIAGALEIAQPGDCVLIAGKGHETYQEFSDAIVPFDDRKVAREVLANLLANK